MKPLLFLCLALAACSRSSSNGSVADVALLDTNPNSSTFQTFVSPRDHLGHATVWYYGSST